MIVDVSYQVSVQSDNQFGGGGGGGGGGVMYTIQFEDGHINIGH